MCNLVFKNSGRLSIFLMAILSLIRPLQAKNITQEEARSLAKEAYIYGFPLVDSYRIQYAYFIDKTSPEYKGPWNAVHSIARVYTPEDKAVQTPNSDTPYSMAGLDLRAEPIVITLPKIEDKRYFSVQLVDSYTFNFAYLGSRTTGNQGGRYLLAGPTWKGTKPAGIDQVIQSETNFAVAIYRTQLFQAADLENVKKIQSGYKVERLSRYLKQKSPAAAPEIQFLLPLSTEEQKTSLEFFRILNFVLQQSPIHPSELNVMQRLAKIGVGPRRTVEIDQMPEDVKAGLKQGMADAWAELQGFQEDALSSGKVTSGDLFGTREFLKNNYLYRFAGAVVGIFGNSKQEAMYPLYLTDAEGQALDASRFDYTLRFEPNQFPPAHAFWSATMYELPSQLLVANPINRYLINSPMLPQLQRDADGGVTLYIQRNAPASDKIANWLPTPMGPFMIVLRLYWPQEAALNGSWVAPAIQRQTGSGSR